MTIEICFYCDDETNGDSAFCAKHEVCLHFIRLGAGKGPYGRMVCSKCPGCPSTSVVNINLKILERYKDPHLHVQKMLYNMDRYTLDKVAMIMTHDLDLNLTLEAVEKGVEAGILKEDDYLKMAKDLKVIHQLREGCRTS